MRRGNHQLSLKSRIKYLVGNCRRKFRYYNTWIHFPYGSDLFKVVCLEKGFELDNVNVLASFIKPNTYYFDVGANIGLMSIPLLSLCPEVRVVSFEPSPNSLPLLERTRRESRFSDRWIIVPKAIFDAPGSVQFTLTDPYTSGLEGIKDTKRATARRTVTVPCSTIDLEWESLGKPTVSIIKTDTEGADIGVLQGAKACILANRPSILTEWNPTNLRAYGIKPGALLDFAKEINYRTFVLPTWQEVADAQYLEICMRYSESFFLCPRNV